METFFSIASRRGVVTAVLQGRDAAAGCRAGGRSRARLDELRIDSVPDGERDFDTAGGRSAACNQGVL